MKLFFQVVIMLLFTGACSENTITGATLLPMMKTTDSVELIFFKSPDSTRFFTYIATTDKLLIANLVHDVCGAVQQERDCPKEGKIYCFSAGQIINTIYFVAEDAHCRHMRYIRNGRLYFFSLSEQLANQLTWYKSMAREPSGTDSTNYQLNRHVR
mgnify:CR=1 FL=1|jgi:hypothetical protein